ncbi:MAG: tRNA (adenosine(37)-N6)-dimethylallyltransferase MiaA [Muribaculaceae bacterium]|nr:tRNA (adenosine(37)-N6)-dimethylallyltransferase MiaA [Muribaculaceae bacterium]
MDLPELIVITGPTASGKSALAIDIARAVGTEVISADSRQIYKGIPVVTAMPSPEELAAVKHHLIDMLPLDAYYSAARFEEDALAIAERLIERNGTAVVCGGSMMYVDALCYGIDILPTVPGSIRQDLEKKFEKKGGDWLREKLRLLDPEYYGIVDLCNTKRVFHAIEIILASGKTYTELRTGKKRKRPFRIKKYMTDLPREILFDRINRRVDLMLENGLEEEARSVYHLRHLNSLNTVGLKEMFAWFEGTMDRETAIARIKKNTRVYAKKQMTWWARDPEIVKGDPDTLQRLILPDSNV